ncbi:hypothetical protein OQA88_5392 [Cercophora sp. LCS_1]
MLEETTHMPNLLPGSNSDPDVVDWNQVDEVNARSWGHGVSAKPAQPLILIEQSRKPNAELLVSTFAEVALAYGHHATTPAVQAAHQRLRNLANHHSSLHELPDDLLKLQTYLLQLVICNICDRSKAGALLAGAVQCMRNPSLLRRRHAQDLTSDHGGKLTAKAVLMVYCMEADYALHRGIPPLLDFDWINYSIGLPANTDDDLVAECNLLAMMHSILRREYSLDAEETGRLRSPLERMQYLQANKSKLTRWLLQYPLPGVPNHEAHIGKPANVLAIVNTCQDEVKQRILRRFYLYHRAIFFMYCPWLSTSCLETPLASAFTVLEVVAGLQASHGVVATVLQDLHGLLPVALSVVLFLVASGSKDDRLKAMPYLGQFGATLGRIAPESKKGEMLSAYFALVASEGFA